jgi:transcriptional regulator
MYAPKQFREERQDVLVASIRSIQFGTLVAAFETELEAAHLPMIIRERPEGVVLEGHVAVSNPLGKIAADGADGLAIFQGPQAYVHPGWYETKRTTGKVVPTWNYIAIHARGRLSIERDPTWLRNHVTELTRLNETGRLEPWAVSDAPADYIDAMLQAIVGVRLEVVTFEGVWKMIQHHPEANRLGVIAGLSEEDGVGGQAVAAIMADRERP